MYVFKHDCPNCGYETWSDKGDKLYCSKCRTPYNRIRIEFSNIFNIQSFLKKECNGFSISKPTVALSDDAIRTFMLIVADYAIRKARHEKAKTILPSHFDWDIIEEFKSFMENKVIGA